MSTNYEEWWSEAWGDIPPPRIGDTIHTRDAQWAVPLH